LWQPRKAGCQPALAYDVERMTNKPLGYRPFYRRHLPHVQPPGATLFLTYRLKGSIPKSVLKELLAERKVSNSYVDAADNTTERVDRVYREEQRLFGRWDSLLDATREGPLWLANPRVARLVAESLRLRSGTVYELHAFCIMPNHVHMVCTPLPDCQGEYHSLAAIMHSLKGYSAYRANRVLGRKGAFWQPETYDRVVRDEEALENTIEYVLNNPVSAGLTSSREDWPWNYLA